MLNRWLARFSLSFFIIAAVLAWSAYKSLQQDQPAWRVAYLLFGAAASIALGFRGTQIKHRGN